MSVALPDIYSTEQPKHGVIPASVYAEIKFAESMRVMDIHALPEERIDYVRRRLIARLYGDIAQDLEAFLQTAFPSGLPPLNSEAADLLSTVRKKLAGEGPGRKTHGSLTPSPSLPLETRTRGA